MDILHRFRTRSGPSAETAEADVPQGESLPAPAERPAGTGSSAENSRPVPVTRTSVAWAGVWVATLVSVAFIVFMLQNTTATQVSFLGLHGTLPLAVAMLIAMLSGILLTLVLGTARITQLRRLASRRRRQNR
ncbi:lipopolysaccharide assembly protein LapA domain-containing protein [Nonomuraea sp. NPDC049158]|uniref:LapA family protein n=1 Tax=Nonomuraea sp. NPDC049158 TaxID=3155649 RepID=UPI0033C6697D